MVKKTLNFLESSHFKSCQFHLLCLNNNYINKNTIIFLIREYYFNTNVEIQINIKEVCKFENMHTYVRPSRRNSYVLEARQMHIQTMSYQQDESIVLPE